QKEAKIERHGYSSVDSAEAYRVGIGPEGSGRCCRNHRVLCFSVIKPEEDASRSGADRHLRKARHDLEAARREAGWFGGSPAQAGTEEEDTKSASSVVPRGSRSASQKMQTGETKPGTCNFRERTVRRA